MVRTLFALLVVFCMAFFENSVCFAEENSIVESFTLYISEGDPLLGERLKTQNASFEQMKPTAAIRQLRSLCISDLIRCYIVAKGATNVIDLHAAGKHILSREECEQYIALLEYHLKKANMISEMNVNEKLELWAYLDLAVKQVNHSFSLFHDLLPNL